MPSRGGQRHVHHPGHVHGVLLLCNGGRWLEGNGKSHRHTVGNAAVYAAVMVGLRPHGFPVGTQGIIGLATPQGGKALPFAEAHRLDGGDGEHMAGDLALHRVPPVRAADTRRKAGDGAGDLSAHAVALRLCFGGAAVQRLLVHDMGRNGNTTS